MAVAVTHETNDADQLILGKLAEGRNTPQNLADDLDYSRQYIQNRLQLLNAAGLVENIGGGVYEATPEGRDEVGRGGDVDPADLQERIDALESDLTEAREDVEYYKSELRDCREQLEEVPDRQQIKRAIEDLEHALENGGADVEVAIRRLKDAAGVE